MPAPPYLPPGNSSGFISSASLLGFDHLWPFTATSWRFMQPRLRRANALHAAGTNQPGVDSALLAWQVPACSVPAEARWSRAGTGHKQPNNCSGPRDAQGGPHSPFIMCVCVGGGEGTQNIPA